jgi:hypothetical protein
MDGGRSLNVRHGDRRKKGLKSLDKPESEMRI